MTSKMKDEPDWFKKPMLERIASILYPNHCSEETKKQMQSVADAQGKRSPMQRFEKKGDRTWLDLDLAQRSSASPITRRIRKSLEVRYAHRPIQR
jgi:hypothetical protein